MFLVECCWGICLKIKKEEKRMEKVFLSLFQTSSWWSWWNPKKKIINSQQHCYVLNNNKKNICSCCLWKTLNSGIFLFRIKLDVDKFGSQKNKKRIKEFLFSIVFYIKLYISVLLCGKKSITISNIYYALSIFFRPKKYI